MGFFLLDLPEMKKSAVVSTHILRITACMEKLLLHFCLYLTNILELALPFCPPGRDCFSFEYAGSALYF